MTSTKLKSGAGSRDLTLPRAMRRALAEKPAAKAAFDKLPQSHQAEYVNWIAGARKEETVQRRLRQLIPMLLGKRNANK